MRRDLEEQKHHYREARREIAELKGNKGKLSFDKHGKAVNFCLIVITTEALQQQVTQSSTQREEIIRLKQEFQLVSRDLALSGMLCSFGDYTSK